jgi:hypothetical protein
MRNIKKGLLLAVCVACLFSRPALAQEGDFELSLDVDSVSVPLPKVFRPAVDLSGRGFHSQATWPQGMAAKATLDGWGKDIGFSGFYRLQYNLWEINALAKEKASQEELLRNYDGILQAITDAQGVAVVDIFSTPAGLGKALDKKSSPWDFKAFKALVKQTVEYLSCEKKYNVWYEVWSSPDNSDFYVGKKQEYLNLYRAVAEAIQELEAAYKVHIPVGGPSTSWWFQNIDGNSILTPERSLIYELIRFCYGRRLPLDFVSWHSYATDPRIEKEVTPYRKTSVALIRDWLSYFHFGPDTPLIIDEWNYDSGTNVLPERGEKAYIGASYIISRLRQMYEAGVDNQMYYCLEDFQNNKEHVTRNVGAFWFDQEAEYKRGPKSIYNVFRMLSLLGKDMLTAPKVNDEFLSVIATKGQEYLACIISNYRDPEIAMDYISRNIATLSSSECKIALTLIKNGKLRKVIFRELDIASLRLTRRLQSLFKKAQELNDQANKFSAANRNVKITLKNLKGDYLYQRYTVDATCSLNCDFVPAEERVVSISEPYQETLSMAPYSVNLIVLKKKPPEPPQPPAPPPPAEEHAPVAAAPQDSSPQENLQVTQP